MGSTFERTARASGMAARQRLATLKLGSALAALAAASLPALAIAAEEDLPGDDQIVVTATRTPLQIEDAPATITVIDDEQIADELATDIKDLVRYEPGVSVRRAPHPARQRKSPAGCGCRRPGSARDCRRCRG